MLAVMKSTVSCHVCGYPANKTENAMDGTSKTECPWCGSTKEVTLESDEPIIHNGHGSAHIGNQIILFQAPLVPKELNLLCKSAEESGGSVFVFEGELVAECGKLPLTLDQVDEELCQSFTDEKYYETDCLSNSDREGIIYE